MEFIWSYNAIYVCETKSRGFGFDIGQQVSFYFPRPQLLMLNVWSASCGVLSSRTDVKLAFFKFYPLQYHAAKEENEARFQQYSEYLGQESGNTFFFFGFSTFFLSF